MRKLRATPNAPASGPPRIVIGRMWFRLPAEGHPSEPMALVAVMLPERIILTHRVSTDPESPPSVTDLIGDLADQQTADGEARPLLIDDADDRRDALIQLELLGLGQLRPQRRSLQVEISKAFGGKLDQLKATYWPGRADAASKPKVRQAQPLTETEAIDAIQTAIDAHNSATLVSTPAVTVEHSSSLKPIHLPLRVRPNRSARSPVEVLALGCGARIGA